MMLLIGGHLQDAWFLDYLLGTFQYQKGKKELLMILSCCELSFGNTEITHKEQRLPFPALMPLSLPITN
jgi:hypothetical protein